MKDFFTPELGMIMERKGQLEVVSSVGYITNIDEDCCKEEYILNFRINDKVDLFHRAKITCDILVSLGFCWNRKNQSYTMDYKGVVVAVFVSRKHYPEIQFCYLTKNDEYITCTFLDELQTVFKKDNGFSLDLLDSK